MTPGQARSRGSGGREGSTPASRPHLKAVEGLGLRQEVSQRLRDAIWEGVLRPGDRLNEQRLADELGVSRPPMREAIRVLEHEGLVTSIPRRGAYVRVLTGKDIEEIYTVRCALESMAAELAIDASDRDLDRLEARVARMERAADEDLRAVIDDDLEFHRSVVNLSGNGRLISMWEHLTGQIRLALSLADPAFFEPEYVQNTHRQLVAAIRRGDLGEIHRLVRYLLDVGRDYRLRWDERVGSDLREDGGSAPDRLGSAVGAPVPEGRSAGEEGGPQR